MHLRHDKDLCLYCGSGDVCDCLERIHCIKTGLVGHTQCGWCFRHDTPRFQCLSTCQFRLAEPPEVQ